MSWFEDASRRRKWLVGVSGGADSVALLRMLVEAGFAKLVVCHLDHRLRGQASTEDARFVKRLAGEMGLEFEGGKVEVMKLAKEAGESMETAARRARHGFFRECGERHGCRRVVLAHHADDQAETLLWNLLRGSHGLKGMREVQRVDGLEFHRPLLGWRRDELRRWLEDRGAKWREDATNGEPVAVRNRLRNEGLPLLGEIAGRDAGAALLRLAGDFAELGEIREWVVGQANAVDPQGRLHGPVMRGLPGPVRRLVVEDFLRKAGVATSREVIGAVARLFDEGAVTSVVNLPGGRTFRRRQGRGWVEGPSGP